MGVGTDSPASNLTVSGNAARVMIENTNTDQWRNASFHLKGPDSLADHAATRIVHGNRNADATDAYFALSSYDHNSQWTGNILIYGNDNQQWVLF